MVVAQNVSLTGQTFVALPAAEVLPVPVLVHGLRVFATENQLQQKIPNYRRALNGGRKHIRAGQILGFER